MALWVDSPAFRWIASALLFAIFPGLRSLFTEAPPARGHHEEPALVRPSTPAGEADAKDVAPPDSLVAALRGDPYGGDCATVTHPYWPLDAQRCSYAIGARNYEVTTATPSAERVARWIVDASTMIPALDRLKSRDKEKWETSLDAIARYTMNQSGRSFPLDGIVYESFEGATAYEFRGGVTFGTEGGHSRTCGDCACRIESLHRNEWCEYVADGLSSEPRVPYAECMSSLGGERGWNDAWASECLALHARAWTSDRNDGYRALLHYVNVHAIAPRFADPNAAEPGDVAKAVVEAFKYPHRASP